MRSGILATGHEGQERINSLRRDSRRTKSFSLFAADGGYIITKKIYLDYNASNPIAPEAVEAMRSFLTQHHGNPSSPHWADAPAKDAVERASAQVATILGCDPTEVIFTSGGSESNKHALKGVFFDHRGLAGRWSPPINHFGLNGGYEFGGSGRFLSSLHC